MKYKIERTIMSNMWCCDPGVSALCGIEPALILNHLLCIKTLNDSYNLYEIGPNYGDYTFFDAEQIMRFFNFMFNDEVFTEHINTLIEYKLLEIVEEDGIKYYKASEEM